VQGLAVLHLALVGMVTGKVDEPVCMAAPLGSPSPMTGCVVDQTGLVISAGVQFVPACAFGSGSEVIDCVELAPSTSDTRYQPGWATVAVTDTMSVCPDWTTVTVPVGVPGVADSRLAFGVAAQGPFFCGLPTPS
jgi:hypothetical protein